MKATGNGTAGDLLGFAGNSGNSSEPICTTTCRTPREFGSGRGLPAPFTNYAAAGRPVNRGELVKGQTIEAR